MEKKAVQLTLQLKMSEFEAEATARCGHRCVLSCLVLSCLVLSCLVLSCADTVLLFSLPTSFLCFSLCGKLVTIYCNHHNDDLPRHSGQDKTNAQEKLKTPDRFSFPRAETIQELQSDLFEAQAAIEQAQKDAQAQIQEVRRTAEAALFGLEVRRRRQNGWFLVFLLFFGFVPSLSW
eukprot:COSAG06_NODE_4379_length_4314_cov_10.994543_5_plen_177_part_00